MVVLCKFTHPRHVYLAGAGADFFCVFRFVGAQNGIYEFHINVHSRKFSPSITMR